MKYSKSLIGVLISACLMLPTVAASKAKILETNCSTVSTDGSGLSDDEKDHFLAIKRAFIAMETLRFATNRDAVLADLYKQSEGKGFNKDVLELREIGKINALRSLMVRDGDIATDEFQNFLGDYKLSEAVHQAVACTMKSIGEINPTSENRFASTYLAELKNKKLEMQNRVGYFDVLVNDCTIENSIHTGNRFADLKSTADERYLVVNATFKNLDHEGRLPLEGQLVINQDGTPYVYDSTESVMHEGYGIRLRSINPLIKLNTKIVYRVPNELSGEVYWQPGRNANDKKLWCTYLPAARKAQ